MLMIALGLVAGCAGTPKGEQSVNSRLADCAKIVEREERTRCVDAAYRSD